MSNGTFFLSSTKNLSIFKLQKIGGMTNRLREVKCDKDTFWISLTIPTLQTWEKSGSSEAIMNQTSPRSPTCSEHTAHKYRRRCYFEFLPEGAKKSLKR